MEYIRYGIRAAGHHLLDILSTQTAVAFNRFYNADAGTETRLAETLWRRLRAAGNEGGYEGPEDPSLKEFGHMLVEAAAWQLEDLGVVAVAFLETKLVDGEPDFWISLTDRGAKFLADGRPFGFRAFVSCTTATAASEWLIAVLGGGSGPGRTLSLREVMALGGSDGCVSVTDDEGNRYGLGTKSYAWAFAVSMLHHARVGNIEPVPESPDHAATWDAFIAEYSHPFPKPELAEPHPVWDVPFRLTPHGIDTHRVMHRCRVGRGG